MAGTGGQQKRQRVLRLGAQHGRDTGPHPPGSPKTGQADMILGVLRRCWRQDAGLGRLRGEAGELTLTSPFSHPPPYLQKP